MGALDHVRLHLVNSVDEAGELMRWLGERHNGNVLAEDVETSGLSPERDHVRLVQFGDGQDGWSIPFGRWGGVAAEVIERWPGEWVCHNLPFEDAFLSKEGIHLPKDRSHDTLKQSHVLDSRGTLALKPLVDRYVDNRFSAGRQILDDAMSAQKWTWGTVPETFGPYWQYGALDTVGTWHLDRVQRPRVMAEAPLSYQLELAVAWVTNKMARYGAMIDRPYIEKLVNQWSKYVEDVESWVRYHYRVAPGSDEQVAAKLLEEGCNLTKMTGTGARYSVDKYVLASLNHPLAQAVLNRRRVDKMVGTYLQNMLRFADHNDVMHPNINPIGGRAKTPGESGGQLGVRTGRMSIDSPSIQNFPVRTLAGDQIRKGVRAREGNALYLSDFSQIEMRVFAHLAQDAGMIHAFRQPDDFFVVMAREIFQEPNFQKSDPRRQWVKNGGYTKIYGGGVEKLAQTIGVDIEIGRAFMNRFDSAFPGGKRLVSWLNAEANRQAREEGESYVRSFLTNRKLVADRGREYALLNYWIQGGAAEILKYKIVQLDQAGVGDYLTLPVHDEIIADVPLNVSEEVGQVFREVMNDNTLLSVPITASLQVADRWGAKE